MEYLVGILILLLMLEGGWIGVLLDRNSDLKEKLERKYLRERYPWDWTREGEKKAQAALELICDKCREPDRCAQDELDEACAMCPVPDAVYRLATGTAGRIATAASALPRNDSEEVRG